MDDLYKSAMDNASKDVKKKVIKNFNKHSEVIKYGDGSRNHKRRRTFNGLLKKKKKKPTANNMVKGGAASCDLLNLSS